MKSVIPSKILKLEKFVAKKFCIEAVTGDKKSLNLAKKNSNSDEKIVFF